MKDTVIYLPSYNAEDTLVPVLKRIPKEIQEQVAEVLVIDDASPDGTARVAEEFKATCGWKNLTVIINPKNLGYGGNQKMAYRYCSERGYKTVAMVHGDGQYAPELLAGLLKPIQDNEADLIFGSRMAGDPLAGRMPLIRYLGNRFLTTCQNWLLGSQLSEFHSGYRIYSVEALAQLPLERLTSDFHFDTEIIILLLDRNMRIGERPIPTFYGDENNHVNIWKYGTDVLLTTTSYWLHKKGLLKSDKWKEILKPYTPAAQQSSFEPYLDRAANSSH